MKNLLKQLLIVIVSVLILAEIALRLTGRYKLYSEITDNRYKIGYNEISDSWYHTRTPNTVNTSTNPEFSYETAVNSLGIREKEVRVIRDTSKIRILTLGDSFVEGMGAPYDSTWPRITEKLLQAKYLPVEVIDAGVAGSDVFFEYVLYRDKLSKFNPNLVIVSINASDYTDYIYRGGMERFKSDGTTHNRPAPWYEPFFRYSHFVRALLKTFKSYSVVGMFLADNEYPAYFAQANKLFAKTLTDFDRELKAKGTSLLVIVHTIPAEIRFPDGINAHDMAYLQALNDTLSKAGLSSISIIQPLQKRFSKEKPISYSHINDMHFNSVGYYYMGQLITDSIIEKGLLEPKN